MEGDIKVRQCEVPSEDLCFAKYADKLCVHKKCDRCEGKGEFMVPYLMGVSVRTDPWRPCYECDGEGLIWEELIDAS